MKTIKITCEGTDYVDYKILVPFQGHLKTLSEENLEKLKKSIIKYGFTVPGFIWQSGKRKYILDSHQRQLALYSLEDDGYIIPDIPIVYIQAKNKTEAKEKLLHITSQYGKFEKDGLSAFLESINADNELFDTLRLADEEIDMSIFGDKEEEKETTGDDDIPEKVKTIAKFGDLWELGEHRLLCGDSTDSETVAKLMDGKKADMVFTDPPYGVSIGDKNKLLDTVQKADRIKTNIKNDTMSPEDLKEMLIKCFVNIKSISNDCCSYYVTAPQGGELGMMMMMMKESGLPVRHVIIWVKNRQCFSFGRLDYEYKHEPILYTWNKKHKYYGKGDYKSSVWEIDKEIKCDLHPTMKPIELIINAILNSSIEDMIVCDYFLGAGATIIASEKTKRICYGMEIDPHYCDVIVTRYRNWCEDNDREPIIKRNGKKQ